MIFRDRREPEEITTLVSQLFLGIRLECAKCHHHPFESWGQDDFYSFAAFFARVGRKGTGLSPPISRRRGNRLHRRQRARSSHPGTRQGAGAANPRAESRCDRRPDCDPRELLADWITADENPYFARVIVNRVWADLMGRGLVEPVDDLRATNPPSNGPLLDALADDFRTHGTT